MGNIIYVDFNAVQNDRKNEVNVPKKEEGRFLRVITKKGTHDIIRKDMMPHYINSGYVVAAI